MAQAVCTLPRISRGALVQTGTTVTHSEPMFVHRGCLCGFIFPIYIYIYIWGGETIYKYPVSSSESEQGCVYQQLCRARPHMQKALLLALTQFYSQWNVHEI